MRLKTTTLLGALPLLIFLGCGRMQVRKELADYIGSPEPHLVSSLGTPNIRRQQKNGQQVYEYYTCGNGYAFGLATPARNAAPGPNCDKWIFYLKDGVVTADEFEKLQ